MFNMQPSEMFNKSQTKHQLERLSTLLRLLPNIPEHQPLFTALGLVLHRTANCRELTDWEAFGGVQTLCVCHIMALDGGTGIRGNDPGA